MRLGGSHGNALLSLPEPQPLKTEPTSQGRVTLGRDESEEFKARYGGSLTFLDRGL